MVQKENTMAADMTDEEYDALDEYYTKYPPEIDLMDDSNYVKGTPKVVPVDDFSVKWLVIKAVETQKSTIEIIHELIQKEITATH